MIALSVARYVRALGLVGIRIRGPEPVEVALIDRPIEDGGVILWTADARSAGDVLAAATDAMNRAGLDLPTGLFECSTEDAKAIIESVAGALSRKTVCHAAVIQAAEALIARVDRSVEELQARGELKEINRRYREYRLAEAEAGRTISPYWAWLDQYKDVLIRAADKVFTP